MGKWFFDPSTPTGAFIIGLLASFAAGFFTGKTYNKRMNSKSKIIGSGNVTISNSEVSGGVINNEKQG